MTDWPQPTRSEPFTLTFEEFAAILSEGDPAGTLFGKAESHFYGHPILDEPEGGDCA